MVRAMSDAIYGGGTVDLIQNGNTFHLKSKPKSPGRAKDVAFAGLGRFRLLGGVFLLIFSIVLLIGGQSFVTDDKGSRGICAVMGHMPLVGLGLAFQMKSIPVENNGHRRP